MKCPVDQAVLDISNRNNIEIDYCPTCRGVWLDRGELDKIIERSESAAPASAPRVESSSYREEPRYEAPRRESSPRYNDDDHHYQKPKKKRESFLGDLFDF